MALGTVVVAVAATTQPATATVDDPVVLFHDARMALARKDPGSACALLARLVTIVPSDTVAARELRRCQDALREVKVPATGKTVAPGISSPPGQARGAKLVVHVNQAVDGCSFPEGPVMTLKVSVGGEGCALERRTYFDNEFPCAELEPGSYDAVVAVSLGPRALPAKTVKIRLEQGDNKLTVDVSCQGGNVKPSFFFAVFPGQ